MRGYVHIYTGDGKGKTTAALGLTLRAVGAGHKVFIGQFIKQGEFSEILLLRARFPEVTIAQFGRGCLIRGRPMPEDVALARQGLQVLREAAASGCYGVVIADEIHCAVSAGCLEVESVLDLIAARAESVELILTGRSAHPRVLEQADLVTEMRAVKHYFNAGVAARTGIEM